MSTPWAEQGDRFISVSGARPPSRAREIDARCTADEAFRAASEGSALLFRDDFHQARQLLTALEKRLEARRPKPTGEMPADFHRHRMFQGQAATTAGRLLVPVEAGRRIPLPRAPEVVEALDGLVGSERSGWMPLRELLGCIGAFEWRRRGVEVTGLSERIHAHHGVFSPVRGEYLELVRQAPLPQPCAEAFDLGTGTGVLALLLASRGVARVVATELSPPALACARENLARSRFGAAVVLDERDLFPEGRAALVVCNPPWLPAKPGSALELALYDPESRMLRAFLEGLSAHLAPNGEGWLVLSDLAEQLRLRSRDELTGWIGAAGLEVVGRLDAAPRHGKAQDPRDPLHAARSRETTSLWRLRAR